MPPIHVSYPEDAIRSVLRIRIDPTNVIHYAFPPKTSAYFRAVRPALCFLRAPRRFTQFVRRTVTQLNAPLFHNGGWDKRAHLLAESRAYRRLHDLNLNRHTFRASQFYQEAAQIIARGKVYKYKRISCVSLKELDEFFEGYLLDLLQSMENYGYIDSKGGDPCYVIISRDGEIIKSIKGRHRFSAAKLTDTKSVPVEVRNIHLDFALQNGLDPNRPMELDWLASLMKRVEERYSPAR